MPLFVQQEEPWFPLKEGYVFIDAVEAEERVRGTLQPYKKEDCEVNDNAVEKIKYAFDDIQR